MDKFCGLKEEHTSLWDVKSNQTTYICSGRSGADQLKNLISYAPQNNLLFESTLRHNLLLNRTENLDILHSWLDKLGLLHLLDRSTGLEEPLSLAQSPFSGGEIQRLGLLRVWLRDQPIEVLDEPTAFLDEKTAEIVRSIITERAKHKLVLVSTHDPLLISQASEVISLHH